MTEILQNLLSWVHLCHVTIMICVETCCLMARAVELAVDSPDTICKPSYVLNYVKWMRFYFGYGAWGIETAPSEGR